MINKIKNIKNFLKKNLNSEPFNYKRKLFHCLGIIIPIVIELEIFKFLNPTHPNTTRIAVVVVLSLTLIFFIILDFLRFKNQKVNSIFLKFFNKLMKKDEVLQHHSTLPYFFACIVLITFFTKPIMTLGLIYLTISDPFAALVGTKYGQIRFSNKRTLEGFLAFIFISFIVGLLYFYILHLTNHEYINFPLLVNTNFNYKLLQMILFGGIIAAIGEFYSRTFFRGLIDDNLIVPIIGSLALAVFGFYFVSYPLNYFFEFIFT